MTTHVKRGGALLLTAMALAAVCGAAAQAAEAPVKLDLEALLKDAQVLPASGVSDQIWTVNVPQDRQVMLLPLRLKPVTQPTVLDKDSIKLNGARFIAFFIPEGGRVGSGMAGGGGEEFVDDGGEQEFGARGFVEGAIGGGGGAGGGAGLGRGLGAFGGVGPGMPNMDIKPPRMTRDITLLPRGGIQWKLTRAMPGSEVAKSGGKAYAMVIDRSQIVKPLPPGAGAGNTRRVGGGGGEDFERAPAQRIDPAQRRAMADQMRQQQAQYQQEVQAYTSTIRLINDLPTEFTEAAPPIVYAVYDFPKLLPRVSISGEAPLPIELRSDVFGALRQIAAGQGEGPVVSAVVAEVIRDNQPVSYSLAAIALSGNTQLHTVSANNPLIEVVDRMMLQAEPAARMSLVQSIGRNPNAASSPLGHRVLARGMTDADAMVALTSLQVSVQQAGQGGQAADPRQMAQMAAAISRMLSSPDAPPMHESLGLLMQVAARNAAATDVFGSQVQLKSVPALRRAEMVDLIVASARRSSQTNQLGAVWVDKQLLGSGDRDLQMLTLAMIAESEQPVAGQQPTAVPVDLGYVRQGPGRNMPWRRMGLIRDDGEAAYDSNIDPEPEAFDDGTGGGMPINTASILTTLSGPAGPIPVAHLNHAIFALMKSEDAILRDAAWTVLHHFGMQPTQTLTAAQFYQAVTDAALAQKPTPVPAVAFFNAPTLDAPRIEALTRLMTLGYGPGRVEALQLLSASDPNRTVNAMIAMTPDQRQDLVGWCYRNRVDGLRSYLHAPAFVGLIRAQGITDNTAAPVVVWFINELRAQPQPPQARQWVAGFGGEESLVMALGSGDQAFARAAAATLLASVAWPEPQLTDQLYQESAKAVTGLGNPTTKQQRLTQVWASFKPKAAASAVSAAAGKYAVTLRFGAATPPPAVAVDPALAGLTAEELQMQREEEEAMRLEEEEMRRAEAAEFGGDPTLSGAPAGPMIQFKPLTRGDELPMQTLPLGEIELQVVGGRVTTSPAPVGIEVVTQPALALRLAKPAELAAMFPQLMEIVAQHGFAEQPIELTPDAYGNWVGTGRSNTARYELHLQRSQ